MVSISPRDMAMVMLLMDDRFVFFPGFGLEPGDDVLGGLGRGDREAAGHEDGAVRRIAGVDRDDVLRPHISKAGGGLDDDERYHGASIPRGGPSDRETKSRALRRAPQGRQAPPRPV